LYVAESIAGDQSTHCGHAQAHTALLLNIFKHFASTYLTTKVIHSGSITSTFDTATHKTVLSAYFLAFAALKAREIDASIPKQESTFLALVSFRGQEPEVSHGISFYFSYFCSDSQLSKV
jgi:hypothetical protein